MTSRTALGHLSVCWIVVLLASCNKPPKPAVEDLSRAENLSSFTLRQLHGTRNGDRLDVEAAFGDHSSAITVKMRFAIGVPTKLESGRWQWTSDPAQKSGGVSERSVMFLGGQDGPPSIGGSFDLLDPAGVAKYRVTISHDGVEGEVADRKRSGRALVGFSARPRSLAALSSSGLGATR